MKKIIKALKNVQKSLKNIFRVAQKKTFSFIDSHPMGSFFGLLTIILVLIVIGNLVRKPKSNGKEKVYVIKDVAVYSIGQAPRVTLQAKIEKSGVIKIISLTAGIVQKIYFTEGQTIKKGQSLMWLSSNYQGASAPGYTRQIAQANYQFLVDNYDAQKDLIAKNRDIANKSESQSSDLRDISGKSIDETKSLISLNENVISMIDEQISGLEAINVNGASNSAILQLKSSKASAQAGLNQAKASVRSMEYQSGGDNEPAQLATLQKDITLKQLDLQEKTLDLNKEIARLNVRLSEIQESLMYPSVPFNGTVERIYVKQGQSVQPGQTIVSIVGDAQTMKAVAYASGNIAAKTSYLEPTLLHVNGTVISLYPAYVSREPVSGTLHAIVYSIPDEFGIYLKNDELITLEIPVGSAKTFAADPFVPIDALYQTQSEASLYVVKQEQKKNIARYKKVTVGQAYGSYIEVLTGLDSGDQVIADRTVIDGDEVNIMH